MARVLYTAEATVTGGRADGHGRSSDGALDVHLRAPTELGGDGAGTNPEQLFAVGFAACFESALGVVGRREHAEVGDVSIDSRVSLLPTEERGFKLAVELHVTLPQVQDPDAGSPDRGVCPPGMPVLERDPRQYRRHAHSQRPPRQLSWRAHRLGRPDPDGRRHRAARRRVPPGGRRPLPGDHDARAVREVARLPGRLPAPVGEPGVRAPGRARRLVQPAPELGDRRPGEVGARRLRRDPGRLARRRAVARATWISSRRGRRATTTSASSGPPRSRGAPARSGCSASPTTRSTSGRSPRCSRRTWRRSARGRAAATSTATSPGMAASSTSSSGSGTRRRSRACSTASASAARGTGATGGLAAGPETLTEQELRANRADTPARGAARTRSLDDYYRDRSPELEKITVPVLSAANWAHHLHTRGNFEGYARASQHAEMAGGARPAALGRVLHRLRSPAAEALLRSLPQGRGHRLGSRSRRSCSRSAGSTAASRSAPRTEWPLPRTQWTRFHLDIDGRQLAPQPDADRAQRDVRRARRRPGVLDAAARAGPGAHRPGQRPGSRSHPRRADADIFLTLRVTRPRRARRYLHKRAGPARLRRLRLAAGLASQDRSRAQPPAPAVAYPRRAAAAHAGRAGRRWMSRSGRPR